jgi:acetylornithine/succinyldiaminopimelate/putrescine aminotransferase
LPDIKFIDFNVTEDLNQITTATAAVIIEVIQGDAGVRIPDAAYMQALRKKCTNAGALLIIDEIQTGFGRTGSFWAYEQYGITPDILTMAKAMGGGLPLGAFAASKSLMSNLTRDPMLGHITTFGGNPVSCAASLATIEVIQQENLLDDVERKGLLFEKEIGSKYIKEIRRKGLMFAIEFNSFETVEKIVKYCLDKGVICFWFLSCPHAFRIAPPLTISDIEIIKASRIIVEGIDHAHQ